MSWEASKRPRIRIPPGPLHALRRTKSISIPEIGNPDLAYETGVHLGDGSLSRDYKYVISGNRVNETTYYKDVLTPLMKSLYSITPALEFQNNSVYLRVYSKELALFKNGVLGLPLGRKLDLAMPGFTRVNRTRSANFLSGLYDTDGSFKTRHDRSGDYPRISLGQKHERLVADVKEELGFHGISSTMYRNDYDRRVSKVETRWFLDVNGMDNLERYVDRIGTRSQYVEDRIRLVRSNCS